MSSLRVFLRVTFVFSVVNALILARPAIAHCQDPAKTRGEFLQTLDISFPKTGAVRPELFNRTLRQVKGHDSEPLVNEINEDVDLTFSPSLRSDEGDIEVSGDPDHSDPREPMIGRSVDLAGVAIEFLILGIDPYPRKSGVEFETRIAGDASEPERPNPFAVLAALKRNEGQGGS